MSRQEIAQFIEKSAALIRYDRICQQELRGRKEDKLSWSQERSLLKALKELAPLDKGKYKFSHDYINLSNRELLEAIGNMRLGYFFSVTWTGKLRYKLDKGRSIKAALYACSASSQVIEFMRKMVGPELPALPRIDSIEEAEKLLGELNRSPSSESAFTQISDTRNKSVLESTAKESVDPKVTANSARP